MRRSVVVLDGYSLLFRAFHALPLMDNGQGEYTNAIHGFLLMLHKVLKTEKPSAVAVAFDVDKHTFRHEKCAFYKANRAPAPEEFKPQAALIKALLAEMGIKVLEKQGYEADDILGTVSMECERQKIPCLLVTGDRDSYQLAGEYTTILYTKRGISDTVRITPDWIKENYGLDPVQLIDVKSLMGDQSDNIPGVSGIGEKTAIKLIQKYGSVEKTLDGADAGEKGALRDRLLAGRQDALTSRFLAEIVRTVPMELDFDSWKTDSLQGGYETLKRLNLSQVIERLELRPSETIREKEYVPVSLTETVPGELEAALRPLLGAPGRIAVSIGNVFTLAHENGACVKVGMQGDLLNPGLEREDALNCLKTLASEGHILIFHDVKALEGDISFLEGRCEDTMLALYSINPSWDVISLKSACSAMEVEYDETYPAAGIMRLWLKAEASLNRDGLSKLYREVELPLCFVLRRMEEAGFLVDKEYIIRLGETFRQRLDSAAKEVYLLAGREVNINSPKQLKELLFTELKLPVPGGKKTAVSTSAEVLEELKDEYPICGVILEYRKYQKLLSTYIEGLLGQISTDGRIHTRFEQAATGTGRISSREPNLQNIPVRTPVGRELRRAFIPREGWVLADADYSQIELRVLAALSGDENMIGAFLQGQDIHAATAARVFGVPPELVTGEMRSRAKAVNFGTVYGISGFGLAKNTGVTPAEAKRFIDSYFARYPRIKEYLEEKKQEGRERGYVTTLLGRRRYLPELASSNFQTRAFGERAAMNSPIQGSAADIIKIAMINTDRLLRERGLKSRLILQVHDELILECPKDEAQEAGDILKQAMENAAALKVPLISEVHTGGNWDECKP
ncbi:MAG: DNA polymerase I [Clostridiales bacterium]|nr:DNA polymerase I [Clostridiales bacterium]